MSMFIIFLFVCVLTIKLNFNIPKGAYSATPTMLRECNQPSIACLFFFSSVKKTKINQAASAG